MITELFNSVERVHFFIEFCNTKVRYHTSNSLLLVFYTMGFLVR